ncbi:MAG: gamma-glutamyltransferase family protein [Tannerella sp.]|jgi:gamma-glutamyltranspeptidase/glutathione hydrolase|nr:gamma-glutamyltransferase family protein [Tannerella sp.]
MKLKDKLSVLGIAFAVQISGFAQTGNHSAIATSHPEAKKAASGILAQGGNAVDAGVAALLTLAVAQTGSVGVAGYGGSLIIYSAKDKKVYAVDFDTKLPENYDLNNFNEKDATIGYKAVSVPGVVSGLYTALKNHGTLSWKQVSQHAYNLAENGIVVDERLHRSLTGFTQIADAVSLKAYLPAGLPEVGSIWKQKDLAKVIKAIGEKGPDAFYKGKLAKKIAKHVQANGGYLSEKDLNTYQAQELEPIKISYRGYEIYAPPVPSAGITSLSILKTLENFNLQKVRPFSAEYFNLFAQASKLTWQERFRFLGDPDFVNVPTQELLSDKAGKERAEKILHDDVVPLNAGVSDPLHTTNVVVIDKAQNIISITATQGNGYGSGVVVPGTGLVFGHGLSRFDYKPGAPNYPAPGKRVQHNMTPTLVLYNGEPYAGLGLPGGRYIVTVTSQLLIDILDYHLSPKQAIEAPRIHNEGDDTVKIFGEVSDADIKDLELKGFKIDKVRGLGGPANIAVIDRKTGKIDAASQAGDAGVEIK